MKIFKIILIFFCVTVAGIWAQQKPDSVEDDFDNYRNFTQATPKSTVKSTPRRAATPRPRKTVKNPSLTPTPSKPAAQVLSAGKPGMKIWAERQVECQNSFLRVVPTTVFKSGDCVRFSFRLNFEGYLVVLYRGSTGKTDIIFPDNQSNKIAPMTDHLIPDNIGWMFDENVGTEELLFIVSRNPLAEKLVKELSATRDFESEVEVSVQASDRDLVKPKTKKDSVYVLADETRLEKPLVFRLNLKHR